MKITEKLLKEIADRKRNGLLVLRNKHIYPSCYLKFNCYNNLYCYSIGNITFTEKGKFLVRAEKDDLDVIKFIEIKNKKALKELEKL